MRANLTWIMQCRLIRRFTREPVVREAYNARKIQALMANVGVRDVRQPETKALFDVIDTDTQPHAHCSCSG